MKSLDESLDRRRPSVWARESSFWVTSMKMKKRGHWSMRGLWLTSEDENFAVAVAQCLCAGRPVIISEHIGTSPDVAAHKAGLVCPLDAAQFADAMARVLDNEHYASELGANGARFANDHYSTKTIGRELVALYREAAHGQ